MSGWKLTREPTRYSQPCGTSDIGDDLIIDDAKRILKERTTLVVGGFASTGYDVVKRRISDGRLCPFRVVFVVDREHCIAVVVVMLALLYHRPAILGVRFGQDIDPFSNFHHLQLHIEADLLIHGEQDFHDLGGIRVDIDAAEKGDLVVDRHTIGACFVNQPLGLGDIVGPDLQTGLGH